VINYFAFDGIIFQEVRESLGLLVSDSEWRIILRLIAGQFE
jgi:hypothetical protein